MSNKNKDLLIIGPMNGEKAGGITVLFEDLVLWCNNNDLSYAFFDNNASNYSSRVEMYIKCIYQMTKHDSIMLNGTARDFSLFSPFLLLFKIVLGKKYFLRKFAGNYKDLYLRSNFINKRIVSQLLKKSSGNFFETKELVAYFSQFNSKTFFFPNVRRKKHFIETSDFSLGGRFIFLSQVRIDKGVIDSIDAINRNEKYNLDIYGPIIDNEVLDIVDANPRVKYLGIVDSNNVAKTLSSYDALVFPTFYEGEGYPGVIIEAFSVGLPVITTKWKAIPEMFTCKELLVEPGDIDMIEESMNKVLIKKEYFCSRSNNSFAEFDSELVYPKVFSMIGSKE
ncbi:glycosyltransferase family 4 protein [Vibrio splendidus]